MIFLPWIAFAVIVIVMVTVGFRDKKEFLRKKSEETKRRLEEQESLLSREKELREQSQRKLAELWRERRAGIREWGQKQTPASYGSQGFQEYEDVVIAALGNQKEVLPN